jgi:preprotein translocase subunit SecB
MIPVLRLERYFLSHLKVDFKIPEGVTEVKVCTTKSNFDFEVATSRENPKKHKMEFSVQVREQNEKGETLGHSIECRFIGFFSFTETTPPGKEGYILLVNGVSMLYGALRGLLGIVTANFPGGPFMLPNIMPQEIVQNVQARKQAELRNRKKLKTGTKSAGRSGGSNKAK